MFGILIMAIKHTGVLWQTYCNYTYKEYFSTSVNKSQVTVLVWRLNRRLSFWWVWGDYGKNDWAIVPWLYLLVVDESLGWLHFLLTYRLVLINILQKIRAYKENLLQDRGSELCLRKRYCRTELCVVDK